MFVGNELNKIKQERPDIEIEPIEITFNFTKAWNDGIRMFPAVKIGEDVLSGVFLSSEKVRTFVEEHLPG